MTPAPRVSEVATTLAGAGLAAGAHRLAARLLGVWLLGAVVAVLVVAWAVSLVVPALVQVLPAAVIVALGDQSACSGCPSA